MTDEASSAVVSDGRNNIDNKDSWTGDHSGEKYNGFSGTGKQESLKEQLENICCRNTNISKSRRDKSGSPLLSSISKSTSPPLISPPGKNNLQELPDGVEMLGVDAFEKIVLETFNESLVFDVRPYNLYELSHIKGAINVCVPTTLLKRISYSVVQILNSISIDGEVKLRVLKRINSVSEKPMKVLLYDLDSEESHVSMRLYHTSMKFVHQNKDHKSFEIYCLRGGYRSISHRASLIEKVENGSLSGTGVYHNNICGILLPSLPLYDQRFLSSIKKNSLLALPLRRSSFVDSNGSKFYGCYPENMPNERESKNVGLDLHNLNRYRYRFSLPKNLSLKANRLPGWLQFFVKYSYDSSNYSSDVVNILCQKFDKIERAEELRLETAINNLNKAEHNSEICSPSAPCPGCDQNHLIHKGIEFGHKNRYKNIWAYEHSMVRLVLSPGTSDITNKEEGEYFNANFLQYFTLSQNKYIATQNPLPSTYEDFWNSVWYNSVKVIICLNKQTLVDSNRDVKYFDTQTFPKRELSVEVIAVFENQSFRMRCIKLTKHAKTKELFHFEYLDWPDFGVPKSFDSILDLINKKNEKMEDGKSKHEAILVHCMAGCGRTGSFIAMDMVLDSLRNSKGHHLDAWGNEDLIFKAVQYERTRRISMVQNLDQFIVIYEFILNCIIDKI